MNHVILIILFHIVNIVNGQYCSNGSATGYLHQEFLETPKNFSIEVMLNSSKGILLHLTNNKDMELEIELDTLKGYIINQKVNGHSTGYPLFELCGFRNILDKLLTLSWTFSGNSTIQCNNMSPLQFPMQYPEGDGKVDLYMLNRPDSNNFSDPSLIGCILSLVYNGQRVPLEIPGNDTQPKSPKMNDNKQSYLSILIIAIVAIFVLIFVLWRIFKNR